MKRLNNIEYVVGIDEAGRGPLAGPVTVGVFLAEKKIKKWLLKNIFNNKLRDSKKLSPKKRGEIYEMFLELKKEGKANLSISHVSNKIIDKFGISYAIQSAINRSLNKIYKRDDRPKCILLDGSLKAPREYKNQKTIIKGDERNIFIACASIVAKVSRDRLMCKLAKNYPKYGFEIHKGYGTKLHYQKIKKYGLSKIHRKSFCKNLYM